ncbi:MFS transporter family glucose-6-phosphate receptor UhpC [Candidatus Aerophobetes bacterium]|uniref:MFS transporter family glucose-6-phosphate receptor UhpC n=1 Tax=Aerophobetes bacterium TaxID=2030807 RepID=A0A2A4X780_UNCAE|nr:MAG: MFS transporter family glucose-6-phosphate receptor UhpC [Candidatus Aerophobetes bacterium]
MPKGLSSYFGPRKGQILGLFDFVSQFKQPVDVGATHEEREIKEKYRYWRFRVFYSMYIGYALFYFTRKSFTFAMPGMINDLGFDKSELGFLGSMLAITYGISKFLSGILSDKSSLRYFMSIGLVLTGVANIFFGLSSSIMLFALFLAMNGFFQGWGAPPCAKLLSYWYSQTERGRWWGLWNTSHNIGGALIPLLCAFAIQTFGWRYAMYAPGVAAIVTGFFLMNRIRDRPSEVGLPDVEVFRHDIGCHEDDKQDKESAKDVLIKYVLKNKFMWILAISFFFVYIVRTAVNDWICLYLIEVKGYSVFLASSCVSWFEIGGMFGSLTAGWLSDTIFRGKRGPVNVMFSAGVGVVLLSWFFMPGSSIAMMSTLMFTVGFFIFGPQMLIGMAAAELAGKKAAGSATGFVGFFAYMGAAVAGYPVGKITQTYGWPGFFMLLACCSAIATTLLFPLWSKKPHGEVVATN